MRSTLQYNKKKKQMITLTIKTYKIFIQHLKKNEVLMFIEVLETLFNFCFDILLRSNLNKQKTHMNRQKSKFVRLYTISIRSLICMLT